MQKDKNKKKTLTISGSFNKKFDSTSYDRSGKKSFLINRKKSSKTPFKPKNTKPKTAARQRYADKQKENVLYKPGDIFKVNEDGWLIKQNVND